MYSMLAAKSINGKERSMVAGPGGGKLPSSIIPCQFIYRYGWTRKSNRVTRPSKPLRGQEEWEPMAVNVTQPVSLNEGFFTSIIITHAEGGYIRDVQRPLYTVEKLSTSNPN